jgi:nucleotide-binding universal stress UspA family protein
MRAAEPEVFRNVLVGVDGRTGGRDAIALALRLADAEGRLTLAHVHVSRMRPSHAVTPDMLVEEGKASAKLLEAERAAAAISSELISMEATSPARGLHELAEKQGVDLLVVGSFSRGVFGRVMLGDDTRAALNGAPCAVAIAAHGYADITSPFTKIGVGYDASPESRVGVAAARKLAEKAGAAVQALEVVPIEGYAFTQIGAADLPGGGIDASLEAFEERLREELPDVASRAVWGLAGEELAAFGGELDLLVVGSRGYGPMKRLILGSTSNYLERHARCSLLVLPRGVSP